MRLPIVFSMLLVLVPITQASAGPMISLSSGDLSTLIVGDTATIEVMLSGLSSGDKLEMLAAEVEFDDQHFGAPTVTSGGIIPDVAGFTVDEFPDLAGATFDSLDTTSTTDMITENGVFFSFDVPANAAGSGYISVIFADAIGEDALGSSIDGALGSAPLQYSIAVPEPGSFALLAVGFFGLASIIRRRRR